MDKKKIADYICRAMHDKKSVLQRNFSAPEGIHYFYVDHLLPDDLARKINQIFPAPGEMTLNRSLREFKLISAQMDRHAELLGEVIFAFQQENVVALVGEITGLKGLVPDPHLYAGGISMMGKGHFLNPHLDNSHDKDRNLYRVLNLLFYVSPGWQETNGGNFELWPNGLKNPPTVVLSAFNRLLVMETNSKSWHSVNKVITNQFRCCVSNYYFSRYSPEGKEFFQVTSFAGRPEQPVRKIVLKLDTILRTKIRKFFPRGLKDTKHRYLRG